MTVKPGKVFGHQLIHPSGLSPTAENLAEVLQRSRAVGAKEGAIFVPATFMSTISPAQFVDIVGASKSSALVCAFMHEDGGNPHSKADRQQCLQSFIEQAAYATALHDAGLGRNLIVGPWDAPWGLNKGYKYDPEGHEEWVQQVDKLLKSLCLGGAIEVLNRFESFVPDTAFETLTGFCRKYPGIYAHLDIGHLVMRVGTELATSVITDLASHTQLLEWANLGRWPLNVERPGLDMEFVIETIRGINTFPKKCSTSIEPFDPAVSKALGLGPKSAGGSGLNDTNVAGVESLRLSVDYLTTRAFITADTSDTDAADTDGAVATVETETDPISVYDET